MRANTEPSWEIMRAPDMRYRWSPLLTFGQGCKDVARHSGGRIIYVATPYSKEVVDDEGRWCEFLHACAINRAASVCADLARAGETAISPIVMTGAMADADEPGALDPLNQAMWERWCAPLLAVAGCLYVPAVEGWDQSFGVWREVTFALEHNVRVFVEAA